MTARTPTHPIPWSTSPVIPRPWQADALPILLDSLRRTRPGAPVRPLIYAVMGSGKSRLLGALCHLALHGRRREEDVIVVAAPRQNLVEQLGATIREHCGREAVGLYYARVKQPRRPVIVCCYQSLPTLTEALAELGRRVVLFAGDEAHRTECATVAAAWAILQPVTAVGFTATPYLADTKATLSLWTEVPYRYPLTQALADGLSAAAAEAGIAVGINHVCGMLTVFFGAGPVCCLAEAQTTDKGRYGHFFHALLEAGIYLPPSPFETWFVDSAHSATDIETTIDAARRAFSRPARR